MKKVNLFFPIISLNKDIKLPEKIDYPHFYSPHPIAIKAAEELQLELEIRNFNHDFGIDNKQRNGAIGKMFGVLVVRNKIGELGYLKAFSGKLGESNFHDGFVPPVFDLLNEDGFFKQEEAILNKLTKEIQQLEKSKSYLQLNEEYKKLENKILEELSESRSILKKQKKQRYELRIEKKSEMSKIDFEKLLQRLKDESISQQLEYKKLANSLLDKLKIKKDEIDKLDSELIELKNYRKLKSNQLQYKIFEHYVFINEKKEKRSLLSIFKDSPFQIPPAGAGECVAPKLFNYAFLNDLDPICMAEFWWGMPPESEVRRHKKYYPACRGKCEPILNHILSASRVEESPLNYQTNPNELDVVFEDEWIVAVNKPAEFLSVPGKTLKDSILNRLKLKYPEATGPLLLHRIDMSTSGILIAAKTHEIHKLLQKQFIDRKIKKVYHAILEGIVEKDKGTIDIPLTLDVLDRPKQKVCFKEGKEAKTRFKVINRKNGKTLVEFHPVTGRTHQLRVHSAHYLGLGCPILGDDLYGLKGERLFLHATQLSFYHPIEKKTITLKNDSQFDVVI